jgi:F0F1-type ATP synthase assembly protein I
MLRQFGIITAAISQLFFMVIIGFFFGDWLDPFLKSTPICSILFALFGIVLGVWNLIHVVQKNQNSDTHI